MPPRSDPRRIFVAGATGFLGTSVAYALLEAGAEITALIPPGGDFRLGESAPSVRLVEGDAWNVASLRGRSRGHGTVIHVIGSLRQQPARGLTYTHLNTDSLRNIARMAMSDGVPHLLFVSAAWAPWLPRSYIKSKREAEHYLRRSGLLWTIARAPLVYPRGRLKNPLLLMISLLGAIPLVGLPFARWAPLPVDVAARGIAQAALRADIHGQIIYGPDLRKLSRVMARQRPPQAAPFAAEATANPVNEDEPPFGWLP